MISVVYFNHEDDGRNIMVGAFLMRSDAEQFINKTYGTDGYKIAGVEDWVSWNNIRKAINTEEEGAAV
jgi:hypothetical protein